MCFTKVIRICLLTGATIAASIWTLTEQASAAWTVGAPIVSYWNGLTLTNDVAQWAVDGGYNLEWANNISEVNKAQQYGLRTILHSSLISSSSLDGGIRQNQLNSLIDQYKASPAAYAYYVGDEPLTKTQIDNYAPLVNYISQRDPDHLCYLNMGHPAWVGESLWQYYIDTLHPKMLSYDAYQLKIVNGANYDEPTYLYNLGRVALYAKQNNLPFMNIVQACAWDSDWRIPSENELRFLVYSTAAYGAKGISYFSWFTQNPDTGGIMPNSDGTPTSVYTALQTLNPQFEKVAEQLQAKKWCGTYLKGYQSLPPGTAQLPTGSPFNISSVTNTMSYTTGAALKGVLFGLFDTDGTNVADATFALIQNLDYSLSKTYTITGPGGNLSVFDTTTGLWTHRGTSQVSVDLLPGEGVLVGLTSMVVPEPSALIMLATGIMALAAYARRKRTQSAK